MTFLRSMYPMPEESWLYRVLSTAIEDADGNSEWLYLHAESGVVASTLFYNIIETYGYVIDVTTAQVYDEVKDDWTDLFWDNPVFPEFTDEDDTSMLF